MRSFKDIAEQLRRGPTDAVGFHLDEVATRAVRLRKVNDELTVTAAEIMPPATIAEGENEVTALPLTVPSKLKAPYAGFAVQAREGMVKLLSFPGSFDGRYEEKIPAQMGLKDADGYRFSTNVVVDGHGRIESKVLAAAMPSDFIKSVLRLLPSGIPAPYSLEPACLSAFTTVLHFLEMQHGNQPVGAIEFGDSKSAFALFIDRCPVLLRRFDLGTETIVSNVQQTLKVDRETAEGIISDGAFDISQPIRKALSPLIKQLIVSRDFIERREDCSVGRIYASGALAHWGNVCADLRSALDLQIEAWDPFAAVAVAADALPENVDTRRHEFAAAIGACLGILEGT